MLDVKPIETVYNGYRFRSRLEARWAIFFDMAGIAYEYEPEGYDLGDNLKYLPDFYLPDDDVWLEVKGKPLTDEEYAKIIRFCDYKCDPARKGSRFRLLQGQIPLPVGIGSKDGTFDSGPIAIPCNVYISPTELAEAFDISPDSNGCFIPGVWIPGCSQKNIPIALMAARQARFEHGESPKRREKVG